MNRSAAPPHIHWYEKPIQYSLQPCSGSFFPTGVDPLLQREVSHVLIKIFSNNQLAESLNII